MGELSGTAFHRRSRPDPTVDGGEHGRWVAVDESGWNGEALDRADEPYVVLGSVAIDDAAAAGVVTDLRREARIQQGDELKFARFTGRGEPDRRRLEVLAAALRPGGPLDGRASVYLADKGFSAAAKIVDLLLEEHAHAHGEVLHANDRARQMARTLYHDGPRALGTDLFGEMVSTFVRFAGAGNRGCAVVSVDQLFAVLDRAERRSHRRNVTEILRQLLTCRDEAVDLGHAQPELAALELLIPAALAVLNDWSRRLGPVTLLLDDQRTFTDDVLDTMERLMTDGHPEFRHVWAGAQPRGLVRGSSVAHPSVQLADLVAGAGRAVALFHAGRPVPAATAGAILAPAVVPLISDCLVPFDDLTRFAAPPPARRTRS